MPLVLRISPRSVEKGWPNVIVSQINCGCFNFCGFPCKADTKRSHIVAGIVLTEDEYQQYRGKFRRTCEPSRTTGAIKIGADLFKEYQAKGASRERLFEAFIKTGGDKDCFLYVLFLLLKKNTVSPSLRQTVCSKECDCVSNFLGFLTHERMNSSSKSLWRGPMNGSMSLIQRVASTQRMKWKIFWSGSRPFL